MVHLVFNCINHRQDVSPEAWLGLDLLEGGISNGNQSKEVKATVDNDDWELRDFASAPRVLNTLRQPQNLRKLCGIWTALVLPLLLHHLLRLQLLISNPNRVQVIGYRCRLVAAPAPYVPQQEDDHDEADLDGGVYAHKTRRSKGSHGGSDSRSRTSMSTSDHGLHQVPSNPNNSVAETQVSSPQPQPGGKEKSSRTSANTGSSTTLQSPSLPSPSLPNEIVSPSTVEQGQGTFLLLDWEEEN